MALSCGSLLLPVQSEAAPQTCEDPRGRWEGTWEERGGEGGYIQNPLYKPLDLQPAVNTV